MRIRPEKRHDLWWGLGSILMTGVVIAGFGFKYGMYFEATHQAQHSFAQLMAFDETLVQMVVVVSLAAGASLALVMYQLLQLVGECVEFFGPDDQTRPVFGDDEIIGRHP